MTTEAPPKKPPQGIEFGECGAGAPAREFPQEIPNADRSRGRAALQGRVNATDEDGALAPEEDDPPELREASLAELLLWRLGVPRDRARMQQQHQVDPINLTPPITTRKVADAIAQISLRIMNGELDATSAKTSLYALQTLLTALRLQIVEEKKARDAKKKKSKSRGRKHANRKR